MTEPLDRIFELLTTSPGNLAYYLALSFTVVAALQASINNFRRTGFPQGRRMLSGLSLLLIVQLIQFAVAGLAWLDLLETELWLPPVDRAVILASTLIVVWMWLLPEPSRLGDVAFGLLFLLAVVFSTTSLLWWSERASRAYFNADWPDWGSNWFAMAVLMLGMLALLFRRPNSWGIGFTMLALLFVGQLIHFLLPQPENDYSGPVRLAQLLAFPWLMTLPQRFPIPSGSPASPAQVRVAERRRYAADPQVVQELVGLLDQPSDPNMGLTITRLISQLMLADFCLLAASDASSNDLTVASGYNLIEEKPVEGFCVEGYAAPMIVNAFKRGKPLRLPSSSTSSDLKSLAAGLNMTRLGHLLAVPLPSAGGMGLILFSPFSHRGWGVEEQTVLSRYARFLAHVLSLQGGAVQAASSQPLPASSSGPESAAETVVSLPQPESDISPQAYAELQASLRFALEQVAELQQELAQAGKPPAIASAPLPDQASLETVLQPPDRAFLETLLQPPEQAGAPVSSPAEDNEAIASLVQELQQPLASITGYTDLLLGESIGILGANQRKFLERIRASVERMGGLADDLLQLTSLNEEALKLRPQGLHLIPVIDAAVREVKDYLRQKDIHLELDIPAELPVLQADETSIRQVVASLLRKASDDSPSSGEVRLRARVEAGEHEPGFVMLQVSDSGEGIPTQELPRVFSRVLPRGRSRSGRSSRDGVDLAAVKAIIEAHGGRIWVDSTLGEGSTYSALLPIPGG